MAFRKAESQDLRQLAELWHGAFPGEMTIPERLRWLESGEPYGGLEDSWVEEQDGIIQGGFKAYQMKQHLGGAALPMLGLAAVAVAPSARRQGIGTRLCRQAIQIGRDRGDVVSILYPFRPDFYQSLGWGFAGGLHVYRFTPNALPDYPERTRVRLARPEDRDAIEACYAEIAADANGPIERSPAIWSHHLDESDRHTFVYEDDGIRGYLFGRYGESLTPSERTLHVRELAALDDEAYRGLLGWISVQSDQWAEVRYDARPDEHLLHRLSDPRFPGFRHERSLWFPTHRVLMGPMLRVLDVPAALRARPQLGDGSAVALTIEVEVEDEQVPENRGPWEIAIEEDGARVHEKGERSNSPGADASIRMNAATFAQIYTGELSPTLAARLGRATIEGAADALDRVFSLPTAFWLPDQF